MYLATVTCDRDFQHMLLQAESVSKFLAPCKHIVIINEDSPDMEFWHRWLDPYYTNHELVLIPRLKYRYPIQSLGMKSKESGEITKVTNGWRTQQLQKLLLAYYYDDDYLLLDSKNFFIKNTKLEDWEESVGCNYAFKNTADIWLPTYKAYSELFGKEQPRYLSPGLPFKISKEKITSKCRMGELAYLLFYPEIQPEPVSVSEFIFYSFFLTDEEIKPAISSPLLKKSHTFWGSHTSDIINLSTNVLSPESDVIVLAYHRDLLGKIKQDDLKELNSLLHQILGFNNSLYPMPRDAIMRPNF